MSDFDYDANPNINPATVHALASCGWIRSGKPLCLIGDSGTGKSHCETPRGASTVPRRRNAMVGAGDRD